MLTFPRRTPRLVAFALVIASILVITARAQGPTSFIVPVHHFNHLQRFSQPSSSGSWSELNTFPPSLFLFYGATNPLLLTDGTVLVEDAGTGSWAALTPDINGSYINGSFSPLNPIPAPYAPLIHPGAVLPDGRVLVEGGVYNQIQFDNLNPVQTNMGAIYDPAAGMWTSVAPPPGWSTIGNGPAVVLADGTYMQGNCCTDEVALFDAKTLTWTATGSSKSAQNQNQGWTLLPHGDVLTVDSYVGNYMAQGTGTQIYDAHTGLWHNAGSTGTQLWDSQAACGEANPSFEIGPGILMPDGKVFYAGADTCPNASGNTAIYHTRTEQWTPGPAFPTGLDMAMGPAAIEPNGKVFMMASPGIGNPGSQFFEWDGNSLTSAPPSDFASEDSSFQGAMLVLPTGQILLTDRSEDVEIYTPAPGYRKDWAPEVKFIHGATRQGSTWELLSGQTYKISGRRFNGMTQGASFGGGSQQSATNYPLLRITNTSTGHVFYCRTHDHSSMAVASEHEVSTFFDIPSTIETGPSALEVVTNGIPSRPEAVEIY
jgi:hypothetical protein